MLKRNSSFCAITLIVAVLGCLVIGPVNAFHFPNPASIHQVGGRKRHVADDNHSAILLLNKWRIGSVEHACTRRSPFFFPPLEMGRAAAVRANTKAKTDAKKAKVNALYGKKIIVAVKAGGSPNPEANMLLKETIARAKANNVPVDVSVVMQHMHLYSSVFFCDHETLISSEKMLFRFSLPCRTLIELLRKPLRRTLQIFPKVCMKPMAMVEQVLSSLYCRCNFT
jgi:hypothetical protein